MILIYTPKDAEPRELVFRPDDLVPDEYERIELLGYWPALPEFIAACQASQRTAWRVALWICLRRDDPTLGLDAVQPRPLDLQMRYEPDEELALAQAYLADPDLPDGMRTLLEANLPALLEAAGKAPATGPAPSDTSDAPAGGTSSTTSA